MPLASSSANAPPTDDNSVPLMFNWGVQYMVETLIVVEAHIATKEIELLWESEIHQGRPLVANPFWTVRILLACGMQKKAQMAHGIREALTLIQRGKQQSGARPWVHDYVNPIFFNGYTVYLKI